MAGKTIGPGDDLEAWCTRCRMNLNHRVIAVVGYEVKRVHCLTCGSDHKYYPPKRAGGPARTSTVVKIRSDSTSGPKPRKANSRAFGEWSTFMKEMPPDAEPRPYKLTDVYAVGEFIEHPALGVGRVLDIVGRQKIKVVFRDGRKVLICNKPE